MVTHISSVPHLGGWIEIRWVKNWGNQGQSVTAKVLYPTEKLLTSVVCQGLPSLVSVNNPGEETECTLSNFAGNTKP